MRCCIHSVRSWVGKQAQLNANLASLGEGQWLITQVITKNASNPEDLDVLALFHLHQHHLTSVIRTSLCGQQGPQLLLNDGRCTSMTLGCHTRKKAEHYQKTKAKGPENYGQTHPHHLCPCQIVGLRVTEVQHQLLHQCHQDLTDLEVPGIHTMVNDVTGSLKATKKSNCQS